MVSQEESISKLDSEFDQLLVDMKPHVLKLSHKSERQKSAVWIKKFCEPLETATSRKNRNLYAKLMLQMLKKGLLEDPFTDKPQPGPLPALPSCMSMYFGGTSQRGEPAITKAPLPDWVAGELPTELSVISSIHPDPMTTLSDPVAVRTRQKYTTPLSNSPPSAAAGFRSRAPDRFDTRAFALTLDEDTTVGTELTSEDEIHLFRSRPRTFKHDQLPREWRGYSPSALLPSGGHWQDESRMSRAQDREVELRTKMVEARYQEEKLRLQQKHDSTVQKILERKNQELEELKEHYRNKTREQDECISKLTGRVQQLQKELTTQHQTKEQQMEELKKSAEEESSNKQLALHRQMQETVAQLEQDKFDLQKQHTCSIQDLLDNTNQRLQKMEEEYSQQQSTTSALIHELESRVHQLTSETELMGQVRGQLEQQRSELEVKATTLQSQLKDAQAKCSDFEKESRRSRDDHEQELRSLRNKHEANVEFLKQEHNLRTVKSADTIADLEQHVAQLKQAVHDAEQQRMNQIRELEQTHLDDQQHMSSLHDNKVRKLQAEVAQLEEDHCNKVLKLEQTIRDKQEEVRKLREAAQHQEQAACQALQELKKQANQDSAKMFEDMKREMERVESDLNKSKQARERQAKEFQHQLQDEQHKYEQQLHEAQVAWEKERTALINEAHKSRQRWQMEQECHLQAMRDSYKQDMGDLESKALERQQADARRLAEVEAQAQALREEVVEANQLRKQQLVELGLLREEEKQKIVRDHEAKLYALKSKMEQQKLELEKQYNLELEQTMEKTNTKLKEMERDYGNCTSKSIQTINELQSTIQQLQAQLSKADSSAEHQLTQAATRADEEKRRLEIQHHSTVQVLQQEAEALKQRARELERKLRLQEQEHEDEELEDTIVSLKSQVNSLQQRAAILQEELDLHHRYSANGLGSSLGSTASIRSAS